MIKLIIIISLFISGSTQIAESDYDLELNDKISSELMFQSCNDQPMSYDEVNLLAEEERMQAYEIIAGFYSCEGTCEYGTCCRIVPNPEDEEVEEDTP